MPESRNSSALSAARRASRALLHSLSELTLRLEPVEFTEPVAPAFQAGVGAHIRHILDHFRAFHAGVGEGFIAYDRDGSVRRRGHAIERDSELCRTELEETARNLEELPPAETPVAVEMTLIPGEPPVVFESTVGRELAFVMHHAIHHNAVIAALLRVRGLQPPEDFGVAPATLDRQQGR